MNLELIVICIAVAWFIVEFEPLHILIRSIKGKVKNNLALYLLGAFSCWQCVTFWLTLVVTFDFFTACVASLGSLITESWIEKR